MKSIILKWTGLLPLLALGCQGVSFTTDDLQAIAEHEFGASRKLISSYESRVKSAAAGEVAKIEDELFWILGADGATVAGRQFACRMLRRVGTARSVPILAALLPDKELSHMARFALQDMPHDAAGAALRSALHEVDEELVPGMLHSLGERRDALAVDEVGAKLASYEGATRTAALEMLGKVGTPTSAAILLRELEASAESERVLLQDSVLVCADGLAKDGKAGAAATIYRKMFADDHPRHVRIAGFRGMVNADPVGSAESVVKMLANEDPTWRGTAARLIAEGQGREATLAYAKFLHRPPDDARVRLLESLAARGDPAALPAISEQVISALTDVHVAAVRALGAVGDASTVPLLVKLAVGGKEEARRSLDVLRGEGVDEALADLLGRSEPAPGVEIARALGARRAVAQVPALLAALGRSTDRSVRTAVFQALAGMATPDHAATMAQQLARATDEGEIAAGIESVCATCLRSDDRDGRVAPVIAALAKANGVGKASLLRVLGKTGGDAAFEAVRASLREGGEVASAAADALRSWPDSGAAEKLLAIAKSTGDPTKRAAAFSGFVHTSTMPGERPTDATAALYRTAFELATTDELRRQALKGIAKVPHADALALAETQLENETVGRDAALAMIAIARDTGDGDLDTALATVERATKACPDDKAVRKAADKAIDHLERNAGYVMTWRLAGPYVKKGKDGGALFDVAFPPEPGGPAGDIAWKSIPATARVDPGYVNFRKWLDDSNCCVYLETLITSGKAQPARLELASDDGIKAWLNGEVVHAKNVMRGLSLGSDVVDVELKQGANTLLLKITQGGGDWKGACRLRSAEGRRLKDVKLSVPR